VNTTGKPPGPSQPTPSGADHRSHARHTVLVAGRLWSGNEWQTCEVVNVSVGGAKLRVLGIYCKDQELVMEIKSCGKFPGVVAWVRGDEVGLHFTGDPAEIAEALIALATFG